MPKHPPPDARTVVAGHAVTYHKELQHIPVIRGAPRVFDLEALTFARAQLSAVGASDADAAAAHPLYSRALSELDRLIDQAKGLRP